MAPRERILVAGATGRIGSNLVQELLSQSSHTRVRVLARNLAKARALFAQLSHASRRIEYAWGSYDDLISFAVALIDVDRLFLLTTNQTAELEMAKIAQAAGVQHIVKVSCPEAAGHMLVEECIVSLGVPYTFLKAQIFMESILWPSNESLRIDEACNFSILTQEIPISAVSVKDIASCAASILSSPIEMHKNMTHFIIGPEVLTSKQLTDKIRRTLGKSVLMDYQAEAWMGSEPQTLTMGKLESLTLTTQELCGRRPTSWDEFLQQR
ncbi:hypothetical protein BC830DRAFT_410309 [Chytriomyces sp. MP71]|nr:hypothetical protein BC830DRAFT_410309 [Chytriomyces sp. MP71]